MSSWERRLDDPAEPVYPIGVVAELLGTDVATVRRYDDTGVVTPGRSGAGQRRYSRNDIAQLKRAMSLSDEGIGPPGIKRILELEARVDELQTRHPDEPEG